MTPLKPKCIYRVNLCDLPWKQAEKSKDEYECLFERKMQGPKLKKSLEFSILLSFYNTNPTEKKPIQRSVINTSIPNENTNVFTLNSSETIENPEIIDPNQIPVFLRFY